MNTVEPRDAAELAEILKDANARGHAVIPRGGGTKSGWGNPPSRAEVTLSTAGMDRVIEHAWADLTVTVEAGCTLACLQSRLAEHGQRLAVDALWPEKATIGGILSVNDTGSLRLAFGGLRDLILGVTIALPDGTVAESGGKVVKNVAGYDLPKLVTGALGTLGVITRAVFRLHPLPKNAKTLSLAGAESGAAHKFMLDVLNSKVRATSLQMRAHPGVQVDILLEGTVEGIAAQESIVRSLAPCAIEEAPAAVWNARQELWEGDGAIVKFSVLPPSLGKVTGAIRGPVVAQATGLGCARVDAGLSALRQEIESLGGSLVVLRQSEPRIDAWGRTGDALPLMRALKQRFDPRGTLNPGRFVGGI
jgi:glycolate oxidase FAD binding subunit